MLVITGASHLGELLKVNHSLQELYMRDNTIGDKGISSVADGLQCNNTLTKLYVSRCGFSEKGTAVYKMSSQNNFVYGLKTATMGIIVTHIASISIKERNIMFYIVCSNDHHRCHFHQSSTDG